jgi:hypothetical protein
MVCTPLACNFIPLSLLSLLPPRLSYEDVKEEEEEEGWDIPVMLAT